MGGVGPTTTTTARKLDFLHGLHLHISTFPHLLPFHAHDPRRRYKLKDRGQIAFGITLQVSAFFLFWLLPSTSRGDIWKFSVASVLFIGALPFIYVAPALQAKLTTRKSQVR